MGKKKNRKYVGVPENDGCNNKSVKLHDSENAWQPRRFKDQNMDDEEVKTEAFTREVFSVLNKLTRQNLTTSVETIRNLNIDTVERMYQVVELVFQKAIRHPILYKEYALMSKELSLMQISGTDPENATTANFGKLIIARCQNEFLKISENVELRKTKAKEVEECTDPEERRKLLWSYEEKETRIRIKSVGNIKFIGELFKVGILSKKVIFFCIEHLLENQDDENLECLSKLLTMIGKILDTNKDELNDYFNQMQHIVNDESQEKISSRVCFMLKDVIDLRANEWMTEKDNITPEILDKILLNIQLDQRLNRDKIKELNIDTEEKIEQLINIMIEKINKNPSSCLKCALICKELFLIQIWRTSNSGNNQSADFIRCITSHAESELKRETANRKWRGIRTGKIEKSGGEQKKELMLTYEKENKSVLLKSVNSMRFIGELFKQGILTKKLILRYIKFFLRNQDDETLECLCTLLKITGKNLDTNNMLRDHFEKIQIIVNNKGEGGICTRIRFMLEDIIDLRANNWLPRRDNNSETMDQIQRETESEELTSYEETNEACCSDNFRKANELNESSENVCKLNKSKDDIVDEREAVADAFAEKVHNVLNELTPETLSASVDKIKELKIDSNEKLIKISNVIFERASENPNSCKEFALMCKELSFMQVLGTDPEVSTTANFRKLIITRCQDEFQNNEFENSKLRERKAKEIEECTDPRKIKELILFYEEEERRIRTKSVSNIRFNGELFNLGMLTEKIMLFCINYLLRNQDEGNLECLCKLLTTTGKILDTNKDDLDECFKRMQNIADDKGPREISSRVRFMLKDVIDLRANRWVPRKYDSNPKTMDQIQKEAETERLDAQLNVPLNTRVSYFCDTSKLEAKPPSMDDLQLGNRNMFMWNKNVPQVGATKTIMTNKFSPLESMTSNNSNPKTMGQIQKEAETERLDAQLNVFLNTPRKDDQMIGRRRNHKAATVAFAEKVHSVLNELTDETLSVSVDKLKALQIDSDEKIKILINVIFERVIDEPNSCTKYALMCKELYLMNDTKLKSRYFKELISTNSEKEFRKQYDYSFWREMKTKEIEECTNPVKKKGELILFYENEKRRMQMKSVSSVRFIGELFTQGILKMEIISSYIHKMLLEDNEENIECLCTLLKTAGKYLDTNKKKLNHCIRQLHNIKNNKDLTDISPEIRIMIKDIIALRKNKWIPNNETAPKTMDQIKMKAEHMLLDNQEKNPLETVQNDNIVKCKTTSSLVDETPLLKQGRNEESEIIVQDGNSTMENNLPSTSSSYFGQRIFIPIRQCTSKSKDSEKHENNENNNLPSTSSSNFGQRIFIPIRQCTSKSKDSEKHENNDYEYPREGGSFSGNSNQPGSASLNAECFVFNGVRSQNISVIPAQTKRASQPTSISNKPEKTEDDLLSIVNIFVEEYIDEGIKENVSLKIRQNFPPSQFSTVIREMIYLVLEMSKDERESISQLLSFLINDKTITLNNVRQGLEEIMDIPMIWPYINDILVHLLIDETHPLSELPITVASLRNKGLSGAFAAELLSRMAKICGPKVFVQKWSQSNLKFIDFINRDQENIVKIINNYRLQFLFEDSNKIKDC